MNLEIDWVEPYEKDGILKTKVHYIERDNCNHEFKVCKVNNDIFYFLDESGEWKNYFVCKNCGKEKTGIRIEATANELLFGEW